MTARIPYGFSPTFLLLLATLAAINPVAASAQSSVSGMLTADTTWRAANSPFHVTGSVRVRLHRGNATVVGRKSPNALYSYELATYDKQDQFDHRSAEGFIKLYGLPIKTQNRVRRAAQSAEGKPAAKKGRSSR